MVFSEALPIGQPVSRDIMDFENSKRTFEERFLVLRFSKKKGNPTPRRTFLCPPGHGFEFVALLLQVRHLGRDLVHPCVIALLRHQRHAKFHQPVEETRHSHNVQRAKHQGQDVQSRHCLRKATAAVGTCYSDRSWWNVRGGHKIGEASEWRGGGGAPSDDKIFMTKGRSDE